MSMTPPPWPSPEHRLPPPWGGRPRDYSGERPALDGVFRALLSAYQYDRTPLRPRVEKADTASNWIRQRVTFTSAEGTDRAILFLYLPKGGTPPYQTVVYFPGSPALDRRSPDEEPTALFDFLLQAGRAVALPAYKGTYDRDDAQFSITQASALSTFSSASYRDLVVAWSKDLQRSVEYLVTRADVDSSRIGFYGFSWGGLLAPIMLVTEPRLKVAVLYIGGLSGERPRPEADEFNFLPRVRVPVLLLNGRYDQVYELHRLQEPFFRLLGTPAADKKHVVYPGGHWVPPDILMRESLAWLDQYFGKPAQRGKYWPPTRGREQRLTCGWT
jgi:dienelactone hydrolase